ncbi:MAG: hypothetical protein KME27_10830 [Lyngbya sp. HA4199-MV5]|jgi:hypothetical protein|nr:hypothetical protein [Lyngbya sp. HA4199-MV5]
MKTTVTFEELRKLHIGDQLENPSRCGVAEVIHNEEHCVAIRVIDGDESLRIGATISYRESESLHGGWEIPQ